MTIATGCPANTVSLRASGSNIRMSSRWRMGRSAAVSTANHAGQRESRGRVDAADPRVRVEAGHEARMEQPDDRPIGLEPGPPGDLFT